MSQEIKIWSVGVWDKYFAVIFYHIILLKLMSATFMKNENNYNSLEQSQNIIYPQNQCYNLYNIHTILYILYKLTNILWLNMNGMQIIAYTRPYMHVKSPSKTTLKKLWRKWWDYQLYSSASKLWDQPKMLWTYLIF